MSESLVQQEEEHCCSFPANDNLINLNLNEDGFPETDDMVIGEESFKAEFYRCGADWSSLITEEVEEEEKSDCKDKKLKQLDLFQMWGFNKLSRCGEDDDSSRDSVLENERKKRKGEVSEEKVVGKKVVGTKKVWSCPFYKKIPGTPFTVDAFRYGGIERCLAYFLSHFHADHYGGLNKKWCHGPIYCTPLTARLVRMCLYIDSSYICPLEFNTEYTIEGIKVTMLEANHCPGAALIHFYLPNGQCYLHTGDFRACRAMQSYPLLKNLRVNVLYLDTTYCNPKYRFPSKEEVLNYVIKVTKNNLKKQPKTLVVVGAYSIGKECVYRAISRALGVKIYANASRRRILQSFEWAELSGCISSNGKETFLHVLPMSHLRFEKLKDYLKSYLDQYDAVLAFRPTGWTFSAAVGNNLDLIKPTSKGNISIYGVPYSEHSSFTELQEFVQFLKPEKIIPTVNVWNASNREKMQSYFRNWLK